MNSSLHLLAWLMRLLPLIVVAVLFWLAWRRGWLRFYGAYTNGGRSPAGAARWAEAGMLLGLSFFVLAATSLRGYDGLLAVSANRPQFETLGWAAAGLTLALCAMTVIPALLGRTVVAVLLTGTVLVAYDVVVSYPEASLAWLVSEIKEAAEPTFKFDATLDDVSIPAQLWINGVYLGRTPLTISRSQLDGLPKWDKPPASLDPPETWTAGYHRSPWGIYGKPESAWSKLRICVQPGSKEGWRTSFGRIHYAGQWAHSTGGHGNDAGWTLRIDFPDVQLLPVERLLDQARANDYTVSPDWLVAIDSLGHIGWETMAKTVEHEPDLAGLVDRWTAWKYGVDKIRTADEAWAVFERICHEADAAGRYFTNTMEGRAVELLVPKLDPEKLITRAEELIRQTTGLSYISSTQRNGEVHFGYCRTGVSGLSGKVSYRSTGNSREVDIGPYVVAHAIWALDRHLDAIDDQAPNLVEQRIPLALLAYHFKDEEALLIANVLGGCPELDRYLLRQEWALAGAGLRSAGGWQHQANRYHYPAVNKWLYLLAQLDSPAGFAFRRQHRREIVQMADDCLENSHSSDRLPAFLFMDLDLGNNSLAAEYWPKLAAVKPGDDEQLRRQFEYLVRMEPVSTTDMYVQVLPSRNLDQTSLQQALKELDILPLPRRRQIVAALRSELEQRGEHPNGNANTGDAHRYLLRELDDCLMRDRQYEAEQIMKDLASMRGDQMRKAIPEWLACDEPDHPVVGLLANSADPQLRLLIMGALRAHPSPAHRAILDKLLNDLDPQVQAAARQVRADLDRLAATPPRELISCGESEIATTQPALSLSIPPPSPPGAGD